MSGCFRSACTSCYVRRSLRALNELTRRVEAQLDGLLAHSRVAVFEQDRGLAQLHARGARSTAGTAQSGHQLARDFAAALGDIAGHEPRSACTGLPRRRNRRSSSTRSTAAFSITTWRSLPPRDRASRISPSCWRCATIIHYIRVLHTALEAARDWKLIDPDLANPAARVKLPTPDDRPSTILTIEQSQALFSVAKPDDIYDQASLFNVVTGMRQGEQLGLRWRDVDPNRHEYRVRQTLQILRAHVNPSGKFGPG